MRRPAVFAIVLAACMGWAPMASAGAVNFFWNDCLGDGGATNKNFACTESSDIVQAVGSFFLENPMSDFNALEITIDLCADPGAVPSWWTFEPVSGACHDHSLSMSFDFSALRNQTCIDPFGMPAIGSLANYAVSGSRARAVGIASIDPNDARPLEASVEYYGVQLRLKEDRATGTDACPGCGTPVILILTNIRALGVSEASHEDCSHPQTSQVITWNNGNYWDCFHDAAKNQPGGE